MMRAICMNNLRCNSVLASRVSMPMRFSTTAVSNEKNKDIANEKSHVFDVTSSNFQDLVLGSSTLVLLDCYANWCPPCRYVFPSSISASSFSSFVYFSHFDRYVHFYSLPPQMYLSLLLACLQSISAYNM